MQRALEREGFKVLRAKDGVEAVDLHHRHQEKIALATLDLDWPPPRAGSFVGRLSSQFGMKNSDGPRFSASFLQILADEMALNSEFNWADNRNLPVAYLLLRNIIGGQDGNISGKAPSIEKGQLAIFGILACLPIDHGFGFWLSRGLTGVRPW